MPGARGGGRVAASGQQGCAPCLGAGTKTRGEPSCASAAAARAARLTLFRGSPSLRRLRPRPLAVGSGSSVVRASNARLALLELRGVSCVPPPSRLLTWALSDASPHSSRSPPLPKPHSLSSFRHLSFLDIQQ